MCRDHLKIELEEKNNEFAIFKSAKKSIEEVTEGLMEQPKEKENIIVDEDLDDQIIDAVIRVVWGLKFDVIVKRYLDICLEIVDPEADVCLIEVTPSQLVDLTSTPLTLYVPEPSNVPSTNVDTSIPHQIPKGETKSRCSQR